MYRRSTAAALGLDVFEKSLEKTASLISGPLPSWLPAAEVQALLAATGLTIDQLMLLLLPAASSFAKPVISDFSVGAVSLGETGSLYFGANIEYLEQALLFGIHAEQAATANAIVHGETGLQSLAVSDAPCGYCRQFLYELNKAKELIIVLGGKPPTLLTTLLPDAFGPSDLGIKGGLMDPQDHNLVLSSGTTDPTALAALGAANGSYSPYTSCFSGVAVRTATGNTYSGLYAENAAYNPSLSPMEAALSTLNLNNEYESELEEVVLVQAQGSKCSQVDAATAVLKSVSSVPLTFEWAQPAT